MTTLSNKTMILMMIAISLTSCGTEEPVKDLKTLSEPTVTTTTTEKVTTAEPVKSESKTEAIPETNSTQMESTDSNIEAPGIPLPSRFPTRPIPVYDPECPTDVSQFDQTRPVFKHLGVDIEPLNPATGRAGAFDLNNLSASGGSMFFEPFGYKPRWGDYAPISDWIFSSAPGTNIYSPIDGVVVNVAHNSNWDDWEIIMQPRNCAKSEYWVVLDHVVDVQVEIGQRLTAGQVVAKKGSFTNNGLFEGNSRSFEITVGNSKKEAFCPLMFFPEAERTQAIAKLAQLMRDIESYSSPTNYLRQDTYNENSWFEDSNAGSFVGCYLEKTTF